MPHNPDQAYREAIRHIQAGRWQEAAGILETWAPRHPHPALWALLGAARHRQGDLERACEAFQTSLDLAPGQPDTLHNLAITLRDLHRPEEAMRYCRRAIALRPDYPAANRLLAELQHNQGDLPGAEHTLRTLLQHHPDDLAAWNNLGLLLSQQGHHSEAMEAFQRGLKKKEDPEIFNNLGLAALHAGHIERARQHLHHARQLTPKNPAIHNNLGLLAEREGRFEHAMRHFQDALNLAPQDPRAHSNLARLHLLRGELNEGWQHYLQRRSRRGRPYRTTLPAELAGQEIVIERDQGIGDELFFLRWLPRLREQGARVRYHSDPRLIPILQRAAIADEISPQPPEAHQAYSVGDLPALLQDQDHPPPVPLVPDPVAQAKLHERLAYLPRPWVALTWEAGTPGPDRLHKRIDPKRLGLALRRLPGTLIAVQHHPRPDDLDTLTQSAERPVEDLNTLHGDLEALLALMALADHYITVSNTALHLRASLGKSAHVLVPHPPEWRWGIHDETSPWFPTCRIHRQSPRGDWADTLKGLENQLLSVLE